MLERPKSFPTSTTEPDPISLRDYRELLLMNRSAPVSGVWALLREEKQVESSIARRDVAPLSYARLHQIFPVPSGFKLSSYISKHVYFYTM